MNKHLSKLPPLLLFIGAIIRIAGTGAAALWFDESVTLYRSTIPFMTLYTNKSDQSGGLFLDLLERPLMAISHSLWLLRLPAMIAGLISLWLVWKLMKKLNFNLNQQIATSALAGFLPGLLWLSQDARPYGLVACLFLSAVWFAIDGAWLGLLACCGLLIYCHTTGSIYAIAALMIMGYLRYSSKEGFSFFDELVLWFLVIAGLWEVWYPAVWRILYMNMGVIQPWAPRLSISVLFVSALQSIWTWMGQSFFMISLFILISSSLLIFSKEHSKERIVILLGWALPLIGLIFVSLIYQNVVIYRTLMPVLPLWCIWLGWELGSISSNSWRNFIQFGMAFGWGMMLLAGLITWNPANRGGYLDKVAAQIRSEWHKGDLIVYITSTVMNPFEYYLTGLPYLQWKNIESGLLYDPDMSPQDIGSLEVAKRIWLIEPVDQLITPAEQSEINAAFPHGKPFAEIAYMQISPIDIYLVEK